MGNSIAIFNETDEFIWFSAEQLGPLEWKLLAPGEKGYIKNLGRVWYTLKIQSDEPSKAESILKPLLFGLTTISVALSVLGIFVALICGILGAIYATPAIAAVVAGIAAIGGGAISIGGLIISVYQGVVTIVFESVQSITHIPGIYAVPENEIGCYYKVTKSLIKEVDYQGQKNSILQKRIKMYPKHGWIFS